MKRIALSLLCFVLGCGGNVVVDHGGGGAGQGGAGQGGHGGSGIGGAGGMSSTLSVPPTTTNVTVSSSTGQQCNTCAQVEGGADASQICAAEKDNYNALLACSCASTGGCQTECGASFCVHQAASTACQSCQSSACVGAFENCIGSTDVSSAVGSTGSGMNCMTCSQFLNGGMDTSELCPGSMSIYNDLATCICSGNCAMKCHSTCQTGNTTQSCQNCVFDPDPQGCDTEWNACESN